MTKKEAIRLSRENELPSAAWLRGFRVWYKRPERLKQRELKKFRILSALELLGMPYEEAAYRVFETDEFEGIPFKTAIYRTKIKKER
jgi:hypothetical protein